MTAVDDSSGSPWALDEYIVVADLYLRRRRSSNARDPEVLELARLTGRSAAAISRRLGNLHGTLNDGVGLKPVIGTAREVFITMSGDDATRQRLADEAHQRLAAARTFGTAESARPSVVLVDPERALTTETAVEVPAGMRTLVRAEAQLVTRYLAWRQARGTRLRAALLTDGSNSLRADLYDPEENLLIEAKADSSRDHLRYAIGQLLDYRRHMHPRPGLAVLLPALPVADMVELLAELSIAIIVEEPDGEFVRHA